MAQIKLYITIPTYNRQEQIQKQVRSLIPQLTDGVRLIVLDNCSPIPVKTLFEPEELKLFEIKRNTVNIGPDANIARCLESGIEGWVWTLGDDDPIKDDAVATIRGLIEENSDCCFINFGAKKDFKALSYEQALQYWGITGTFGRSFFMSHCIFNMSLLKNSLRHYYSFLSSQVGQICLILKYLEENPNGRVCFCKDGLITYNAPGGWDPLALIINSSIVIDRLEYDRKHLKSSLFKGLGDMYLTSIAENRSRASFSKQMHVLCYISRKLRLHNLIRYNFVTLSGLLVRILFPKRIYEYLRSRKAKSYNKNLV